MIIVPNASVEPETKLMNVHSFAKSAIKPISVMLLCTHTTKLSMKVKKHSQLGIMIKTNRSLKSISSPQNSQETNASMLWVMLKGHTPKEREKSLYTTTMSHDRMDNSNSLS